MPHMEDVPTSVINETQVVVASTKTSRKSRVELTIQQKLNVCAAIDNGKMQHVIAKEYKLEVSTVRKLFKKKQLWKQLVRLGYGRKYQYHPPTKNRELYEQGAETVQILREPVVGVTKSMMFNFFNEISQHFRELTDKGQEYFWLQFCKWANISLRRVNGCTQVLAADADLRVSEWKDMLSLMNLDHGGYSVVITGYETPVVWEPVSTATYEFRGAKRVKIRTTGKERSITTGWLSSRSVRGLGNVWSHTMNPTHLIWSAHSQKGAISQQTESASRKYGCTSITTKSGWMKGEAFLL